ncbi:uncharacterized protein [Anabrus simplex]|uniref:uncharacterized protein n=1 Tax=Anabrus simplex TaxID=316456 RepID=UPI0034DD06BD
MDLEIKIKEEPAWLEGTTTASLENFEHVSEVIVLKDEVKSELTESGSSHENYLEPSEDIKEEILIEEHSDVQLLPYIKEETKYGGQSILDSYVMHLLVPTVHSQLVARNIHVSPQNYQYQLVLSP